MVTRWTGAVTCRGGHLSDSSCHWLPYSAIPPTPRILFFILTVFTKGSRACFSEEEARWWVHREWGVLTGTWRLRISGRSPDPTGAGGASWTESGWTGGREAEPELKREDVLVCSGSRTKYCRQGGFNSEHLFPLEAGSPRSKCWQVQLLPRPLSLACRYRLLPLLSHGLPSVCVCVLISSYMETSHLGLGPTLMTSFYLNYLLKTHPQIHTFWGTGG